MHTPTHRIARAAAASLAAILACAGGCVSAERAAPVVAAQRDAIARLEAATSQDAAALRAATVTLLDARRERLFLRIETEIAGRYIAPTGGADQSALQADIDAAFDGALAGEARSGRMTRDEVVALLRDYAAADALTDRADYRRQLLAHLGPIARYDEAKAALLRALDTRAASEASLFADAQASSHAIAEALNTGPIADDASRTAALALWRSSLVTRLTGENAQASGAALLEALFGAGANTTNSGSHP